MRLLLVEDDVEASQYLVKGLSESGHVVDHAGDGESGLHLAMTGTYDVIVLDQMLPERDGLTIVKVLRADSNATPILLLSAKGEVEDRVAGLRAGGDDYLVKPYAFSELLARLESLARRALRAGSSQSEILEVGDLRFDLSKRKVRRGTTILALQPREMRLLEVLMRNVGRVVTRTMLLEQVWDIHFDPQSNVIDTQISRLRNKIDRDFPNKLLETVRGVGYRLNDTLTR